MNDMKNVKAPRYEALVKELWLDNAPEPVDVEEQEIPIDLYAPTPMEIEKPESHWAAKDIIAERNARIEETIKENADRIEIDWVPATQIPKYQSPTERRYPVNWIFETDDKKCYVLHWTVYAWDDIEILSSSNEFIKDFDTPDTEDWLMKVFNCFDK